MATFYLFDSSSASIANAPLVAVRKSTPLVPFSIGTNIPVRVDDSVHLTGTPTTLASLLTMKHAGMLLQSQFDNIVYDDFLENPQFDATNTEPYRAGDRGSVAINYVGYVYTDAVALGGTPTSVQLSFDAWWITYETDAVSGQLSRMLTDITNHVFPAGPVANTYTTLDFGGSSSNFLVTPGEPTAIPASYQGSSFTLGLRNYDYAQWVYSGGWALMY